MTKEEIIRETVEYYKDASKRGYDEVKEACMYLTEGGNMCAVGRCLIPGSMMEVKRPFIPLKMVEMEGCQASVMNIENLEEILKPEYRGHSIKFWIRLQNLHDSYEFYTDGTMNEQGLEHAKYLWREWESDN
jgi:hypothetical protein